MSKPIERVEIISGIHRRRRYTAEEKVRLVEQTMQPGMTVSAVARLHGVSPSLQPGRHSGATVEDFDDELRAVDPGGAFDALGFGVGGVVDEVVDGLLEGCVGNQQGRRRAAVDARGERHVGPQAAPAVHCIQ